MRYFATVLIAGGAFALAACAKSDPSQLISPTTVTAGVSGSFAENPIPFAGRGNCNAAFPNSWIVRPALREANGVGVTLKSWQYAVKDGSGAVVDSEDTSEFIANAFGSARLGPHGTLSAAFRDCERANFTGGSVEFTFFGVDDGGFPVSLTMSATLTR